MRLEEVRQKAKLSQMGAADKADLSLRTWQTFEEGNPETAKTLKAIAKSFNVVCQIHPDGSISYRKP